jgi:glycine/D-amino acid oxidase-like deaminating enzyme
MSNGSSTHNKKPPTTVAVVGAGVIGLSVATHLLEKFGQELSLTVIADKFSPNTTASDKSGGWIYPPGEYDEKAASRMRASMKRFDQLHNSEICHLTGLNLVHGYLQSRSLVTKESRPLGGDQLKGLRVTQGEVHDYDNLLYAFSTYIISCPVYLPWLMGKIKELGGSMECRKINNLSELVSYGVVINCTGMGARELVNDQNMYPLRGHMMSVKAPWIKQWHIRRIPFDNNISRSALIFPHADKVLLGGTHEASESLSVDHCQIDEMVKWCSRVVPSLTNAEIIDKWVGIRPMRKGGVRLERDESAEQCIIHCYGHGSDGVSLSWGCAEEVGVLVEHAIYQHCS